MNDAWTLLIRTIEPAGDDPIEALPAIDDVMREYLRTAEAGRVLVRLCGVARRVAIDTHDEETAYNLAVTHWLKWVALNDAPLSAALFTRVILREVLTQNDALRAEIATLSQHLPAVVIR